ncbi:MAG: hypothetical protein ACREXK_01945 [Gammaproteobacteria bacterium]
MTAEEKQVDNLRGFLESAYDEILKRKGKPRRNSLKPLAAEIRHLQERERFIKLCRESPSMVRVWIAEFRHERDCAVDGGVPRFAFPLFYLLYVNALAQAPSDLDLADDAGVRRMLGCGTLEEEIGKASLLRRQRRVAGMPRPDALQDAIVAIVEKNPSVTWRWVYRILVEDGFAATTADGNFIEWADNDGTTKCTPVDSLRHRTSRAKQKVALAG